MTQVNALGVATQGVQYFNGVSVYSGVTGATGQVLQATTSNSPTYSTATYPSTSTINQLLYSSSNNTIVGLATANSAVLITSAGGVPSLSQTIPTAVQSNITQVGTITSGTWQGSVIGTTWGGTGTGTTFTAGSIVFADGSGNYTQDNSNLFWDNTNKAMGVGTNTPNSGTATKFRIDNTSSSVRTASHITGTWTTSIGIPTGLHIEANFTPTSGVTCIGVDSDSIFAAPAASTVTGISFQASPAFAGNAGTVVAYGFFYDGGGPLVGTVSFQWGGYFSTPVAGTNKIGLYAGNIAAGTYTTNVPPANGMIVSGAAGVGTAAPVSKFDVAGNVSIGAYGGVSAAPANGMIVSGAVGFGASSLSARLHLASPSTSTSNPYASYVTGEIVSTTTSFTSAAAIDCFISPSNTASVGATHLLFPKFAPAGGITLAAAIYIDAGSSTGTITTGYGLYVSNPGFGTAKYCAYFGGKVGIGNATPVAGAMLQVDSTTSGFLPPRVTTSQKNAITAVAGLIVFDTDLGTLNYYNGSVWVPT